MFISEGHFFQYPILYIFRKFFCFRICLRVCIPNQPLRRRWNSPVSLVRTTIEGSNFWSHSHKASKAGKKKLDLKTTYNKEVPHHPMSNILPPSKTLMGCNFWNPRHRQKPPIQIVRNQKVGLGENMVGFF